MHPDVKPYLFDIPVRDDAPPNLEAFNDGKLIIYEMRINEELCGIVSFEKHDDVALVDVAFLPSYRGKDALKFATPLLSNYSDTQNVRGLYAKIRLSNKRSLVFCKWCGFSVYRKDDKFYYVRKIWATH